MNAIPHYYEKYNNKLSGIYFCGVMWLHLNKKYLNNKKQKL